MKTLNQKLLPAFLILGIFSSCVFMEPPLKGDGNVSQEVRKTGDFSKISVSAAMNVYINQGVETKVVVVADENILDAIETRNEGGTLKITVSKNIWKYTQKKVVITVPNLEAISSIAGSNVFSEDTLKLKSVELTATAGANMKMMIIAENLKVSSIAGSNIKLEGSADDFEVKANSGSNINAKGLKSKLCRIKCNGGANIWLTVTGNIEGHVGSGANIYYFGNPTSVNVDANTGGNLIKKQD